MREGDPAFEALRSAIESFAAARAPELVAEARIEAVGRARTMLAEAIAEELLARSSDILQAEGTTPPPAKPAPRPTRKPATPPPAKPPPEAPPRAAAPERAKPVEAGTGCYVYGIVGAGAEAAKEGLGEPGVDAAHPTRVVEHGGLAAIVSDVPLSEFGEEPLVENLNEVEWLERTARAHERVLDEALVRSAVVPLRLCTIYRGEDQVREMLERERSALMDALERLEGKTEWGVKAIAAPGVLEREVAGDGDDRAAPSAGTAYLDAKRRQAQTDEDREELADRWGFDIHDRLAAIAAEALLNPLQAPDVGGYEGEMLLNGVYLVEDSDAEKFKGLVAEASAEWEERGVALTLTGPWPAYNFVKNSIEAAR
jgi:osmotically-inducible protein OsmY